jgi:hypothetical protein
VSAYEEFVFWAKTDDADGSDIEVLFRDADWDSNWPQVNTPPVPPDIGNEWTKHVVNLGDMNESHGLNLSKLEHLGLAFGQNVGNSPGTIIYVDDMGVTGSETETPLSNGAEMPAVFPQNWPYGSVAATAWFVFVELKTNPFAVSCKVEQEMKLTPQMLNCKSKGKWVKAHISLAEGFYPEEVDVDSVAVAEPMGVESEYIKVLEQGNGRFGVEIGFDRAGFCEFELESEDGYLEVGVVGWFLTGQRFEGVDTIKVINEY